MHSVGLVTVVRVLAHMLLFYCEKQIRFTQLILIDYGLTCSNVTYNKHAVNQEIVNKCGVECSVVNGMANYATYVSHLACCMYLTRNQNKQ